MVGRVTGCDDRIGTAAPPVRAPARSGWPECLDPCMGAVTWNVCEMRSPTRFALYGLLGAAVPCSHGLPRGVLLYVSA